MDALGVDMGGVIIARMGAKSGTSFYGDNFLKTPSLPGVFDALARLVREKFGDRVYLVSMCGQKTQEKSMAWLHHNRFFDLTGISPYHVRFCRERSGKAPIATELALTHFVDDSPEVQGYLVDVAHRYLFQPREQDLSRYAHALNGLCVVQSWDEVCSIILGADA